MEHKGLLTGIRILDLTAGGTSFCSKILADLGASVIKIEKPGTHLAPLTPSFLYHNLNKRSITLNIEKKEGLKLLLQLSKKADVIIESYPPGYMGKLGCSYETVSKVNPKVIMVSITGFGQKGPRSNYKSCDLVAAAYGGQMYVSGEPSSVPLKAYGEQSAYVSSLFAAVAVLLALIKRRSTGKGEHVDISTQEAVASTLDHVLVRYFYDGIVPKRQGSLAWNRSAFILPCKDGHIFVSIANQWETLVEWLDAEGMAQDLTDDKWKDEAFRHQNVDHIRNVLEQWTLQHEVDELFEIAQAMRFPWAPVYRPEDVLSNPQLQDRAFFCTASHPTSGEALLFPGVPYRFNTYPTKTTGHIPTPGEDNRTIYCEELGLTTGEISRLTKLGVI